MRPIHAIASEALQDWKPPLGPALLPAWPYLRAMLSMSTLDGTYGVDPAEDIVLRFLSNATSWRGEIARRCKKELSDMLRDYKRQGRRVNAARRAR